jgi:hypothetical protein
MSAEGFERRHGLAFSPMTSRATGKQSDESSNRKSRF